MRLPFFAYTRFRPPPSEDRNSPLSPKRPAVRRGRRRWRAPAARHALYEMFVAHLLLRVVAVGGERPLRGEGRRGLTALADALVEYGLVREPAVGVEGRVA